MKHDSQSLAHVAEVWRTLGREDPLWAVYSLPEKRGRRWDLEDFLRTGEEDVARAAECIGRHAGAQGRFGQVLDFGCGVGRLVRAWSNRAGRVTGVDISETMLEHARKILADRPNAEVVHNPREDLSVFADGSFDLVFSLICLQHMPWRLARGYIIEFGRICRPGGVVAFQLPTRAYHGGWAGRLRRRLVDGLPFGLATRYRQWSHGSSVVFDVFHTPTAEVEAAAAVGGLQLLGREPDTAAGPGVESFFYVFRKR
ncbi:MAG: class I SAM-dependent methyltransferase [Limisphaerales bacterium]